MWNSHAYCDRVTLYVIKEVNNCEKLTTANMIVSFSVSNFRSFSSEQTLSLVASNRLNGTHEEHACSIPGVKEKVLKTAVLYGANGAGKSNLFKALLYLKTIALKPKKKNSSMKLEKFRFDTNAAEASVFDSTLFSNV